MSSSGIGYEHRKSPSHPLLAEPDAVLACYNGRDIGLTEFQQDVAQLVNSLPASGHMVNLCQDRYHFLVGLTAAMEKEQVNLLLPNRSPDFIQQIQKQFEDLYCLVDDDFTMEQVPLVSYEHRTPQPVVKKPGLAYPPEQVVAIAFTSGTTGMPRPNIKTWACLTQVAQMTASRFNLLDKAKGSIVATVPPQHMYGLEASVMLPLQTGWKLHAGRPFFPADVAHTLANVTGPRVLVTTPVHIRAMLAELDVVPRLDLIISATAPLSEKLAQQAEARFNTRVFEIFGFTEVGSAATRRTVDGPVWHLFEKIRLALLHGDNVLETPYIKEAVIISDVVEPIDASHFRLRGRNSDMVNIAGKRASLGDLNIKLNEIEGVSDGVLFNPDETDEKVQRLMAFVVAPDLTPESISSALRNKIDAAFIPRPIIMLECLPRNETGKLPRQRLLELVASHVG